METNQPHRTRSLQLADWRVEDLIHSPPEARFNRLVRLARRALNTRVAALSFFNEAGEWIKSSSGWNANHLTPERSLAMGLVKDGSMVVIGDTLQDPRTRNHPLVTGAPNYRFCALQPIVDRAGKVIGAIAGYDIAPRAVKGDLVEAVADAAEFAQRELQLTELGSLQQMGVTGIDATKRAGMFDELTQLWNRNSGLLMLKRALGGEQADTTIGVCVMDVDELKTVNEKHGRGVGDAMLRQVGAALVDGIRPGDVVCRLGGDEFLLLIPDIDPDQLARLMDRVKERVQRKAFHVRTGPVKVSVSLGGTIACSGKIETPGEVLRRAVEAMQDGKRQRAAQTARTGPVVAGPARNAPASVPTPRSAKPAANPPRKPVRPPSNNPGS